MKLECLIIILTCGFVIATDSLVGAELEERSVVNPNTGKVVLMTPKEWDAGYREHFTFGTTFYRLTPPKKEFNLEILFNDLKHMKMDALVDKDLERYIESNMAGAVGQSVEGEARAKRFGTKKDGVYARLTDKAPKAGDWLYFTQGVRLLGSNVVLFTLMSNDKDGAVLSNALSVVGSVRFEPKASTQQSK